MKNKIIVISTLLAGLFIMNSCLKDDADYWKEGVAGKMYATVLVPTLQAMALQPVAGDVNYEFMVNIATDALPSEDITVTLKIDPAAVSDYNTLKGKSYLAYPNIQILTPTVTIAKGTRTAMVQCKVWGAETLNACDNFIAAVSIETVSNNVPVAANMKTYLLSLPISNPYSGDYNCVGYRIRPGNPTEPIVAVETASTIDCKTIKKSGFGNYPYDITIEVTSNIIVVGGVNCYKVLLRVIDPATGAPLAGGEGMFTTWAGDAATPPAAPANNNEINYYNPVTKTFILNAYYVSSAGNRIMYEKLTRI